MLKEPAQAIETPLPGGICQPHASKELVARGKGSLLGILGEDAWVRGEGSNPRVAVRGLGPHVSHYREEKRHL